MPEPMSPVLKKTLFTAASASGSSAGRSTCSQRLWLIYRELHGTREPYSETVSTNLTDFTISPAIIALS